MFTGDFMVQVQLRMPEENVKELDQWVKQGKFKSRSDAVKTIIVLYEDKMKTMEFMKMLISRSKEAKEKPEMLISLDDIDV